MCYNPTERIKKRGKKYDIRQTYQPLLPEVCRMADCGTGGADSGGLLPVGGSQTIPHGDQRNEQRFGYGGRCSDGVRHGFSSGQNLYAAGGNHSGHGGRTLSVAGVHFWRGHQGGDRSAQRDVQPRQGSEPGVLSGQQGGQSDEPVHQRSGHGAGLLWLRLPDVL